MPRILVVDDDAQVRGMIRQVLEREQYTVDDAGDGRAGMAKMQTSTYDLIILDIIMPEQEGLETIMQLRKGKMSAKILAISGGGRVGPGSYLPLAKQLGAHEVLAKPFDREELLAAVKRLLADPA